MKGGVLSFECSCTSQFFPLNCCENDSKLPRAKEYDFRVGMKPVLIVKLLGTKILFPNNECRISLKTNTHTKNPDNEYKLAKGLSTIHL